MNPKIIYALKFASAVMIPVLTLAISATLEFFEENKETKND